MGGTWVAMQIFTVIPAYNEQAGIGGTLGALTRSPSSGSDIQVVVVPNGCTDATAEVARGYGVTVVEIPTGSKTAAMNAAESVVEGSPRVYVDADIAVTPEVIRALATALCEPGVHAAVPNATVDATNSSWPVRAFYAVNAKLPVFSGRLFGRGVIAISAEARARFAEFPDIIADDMFLDAMVAAGEKREVAVTVSVPAPRRAGDLIRRVARSRAGNAEFWAYVREQGLGVDPVPGASMTSWLRDVVLRSPRLWLPAVCYVAITLLADAKRRRPGWNARSGWGRPTPVIPRQAGPADSAVAAGGPPEGAEAQR